MEVRGKSEHKGKEDWVSRTGAQPIERRTMHTEAKTLSVKENQTSFISYLLRDGRDGNIRDIPVNEFWTRVAMHPLKGTRHDLNFLRALQWMHRYPCPKFIYRNVPNISIASIPQQIANK